MKRLRVLMLTSSYPISGSNLGPFVQNIVKGLVESGVEVGVMIFSTTKKYKTYKKDGAVIYEYPYTRLSDPQLHKNMGLIPSIKSSNLAKLQLPGYLLSTMKNLKRISKNYDVIHAHWFLPSGFIACLLKSNIKKPIITTAWGAEFHLPKNTLVKKALNFVNTRSDKVIAVSKYMKSKAGEYGLDTSRMEVIPNCIDVKQFSVQRKKHKKIIIGTVRRLVPEKRIDDLINAVAMLPEKTRGRIELWIVGDGPERGKLTKLVNDKKIGKITRFWGMVEHKKIPEILSQIDIYVNPSVQEGMATANIEAMVAGCCVIATNGFGNDEVILDKKNGFLYDSKRLNTLILILNKLISDWKLRYQIIKKSNFNIIQFSCEKVAKNYLERYSKILNI